MISIETFILIHVKKWVQGIRRECDVVIDECSLDEMNVHQIKMKKHVWERKEERCFAYSWAAYTAWRTRHWFESSAKDWFFFRSVALLTIDFWKKIFCLWSEVPRWDLNGDGGYRPCWFRICKSFFPGTYISKPLHGDMHFVPKNTILFMISPIIISSLK